MSQSETFYKLEAIPYIWMFMWHSSNAFDCDKIKDCSVIKSPSIKKKKKLLHFIFSPLHIYLLIFSLGNPQVFRLRSVSYLLLVLCAAVASKYDGEREMFEGDGKPHFKEEIRGQ